MASMEPIPDMYIGGLAGVPFESRWCWECEWVPLVVPLAVRLVVPFVMLWSGARGLSVVVSNVMECAVEGIVRKYSAMRRSFERIAGLK